MIKCSVGGRRERGEWERKEARQREEEEGARVREEALTHSLAAQGHSASRTLDTRNHTLCSIALSLSSLLLLPKRSLILASAPKAMIDHHYSLD